jgi:hypothetical protein
LPTPRTHWHPGDELSIDGTTPDIELTKDVREHLFYLINRGEFDEFEG